MKTDIEKLEQEYQALQKDHSEAEWSSIKFLMSKSAELESENLFLSFRLLQRAKNLEPENKKLKEAYERVRAAVKTKNPGVLQMRSIKEKAQEKLVTAEKKITPIYKFLKRKPAVAFVLIPWFLFAFYQLFIASERYESISRIIVKQPSTIAAPLPEMALLGSLGMSSGGNDSSLVHAYIYSTDLLKYLNAELDVYGHYTSRNIDIFSRLASDAEQEDFYAFYKEHVTVLLDPASQIIDISVQGFEPVFAQKLNLLIVERTEWYINTISQRLAQNQLEFINSEHERVETKFAKARTELLEFQEKHELLNPEAEGAAMQNITYGLESQIVNKQAELIALSQYMSNESSEVKTAKNQLTALTKQLESERQRLSAVTGKNISVSQLLGKFQELKVNVELAMQSFASSLVSMEKSRVEAYQQVKYLVTVQNPPLPQSAAYPTVWYNIILFGVIAFLLFGIVRIVVATILELS